MRRKRNVCQLLCLFPPSAGACGEAVHHASFALGSLRATGVVRPRRTYTRDLHATYEVWNRRPRRSSVLRDSHCRKSASIAITARHTPRHWHPAGPPRIPNSAHSGADFARHVFQGEVAAQPRSAQIGSQTLQCLLHLKRRCGGQCILAGHTFYSIENVDSCFIKHVGPRSA